MRQSSCTRKVVPHVCPCCHHPDAIGYEKLTCEDPDSPVCLATQFLDEEEKLNVDGPDVKWDR